MPDYQKGKIYKLWSPQGNEIYIGSTINPLSKRLGQHKADSRCRSKYLFENYDNVKIELIQEYPCNNKMELNRQKGEHIRNNDCLNKLIAGRTKKEYIKEYYENNKENINEKRSEKIECDCGGK
jgi:antirestriction protein